MPTLYVIEPYARVEKEYNTFLITGQEGEILSSIPMIRVSEVVLVGSAGVTTRALWAMLENGIGLSLLNRSGRMLGYLAPPQAFNLPLRHQQYRCAQQPDFALQISKAIVQAKLKNSRTFLRRILRQKKHAENENLRAASAGALQANRWALEQIDSAVDLAALRGYEGLSSRAYFGALRKALRPELSFERRTRRPPQDAANALLSLAYSMLANACFSACRIAGLDPYDGFYHADRYGRPALALDLLEEFRSILADSLVLNLVNKRILTLKDFETVNQNGKTGVYLTRSGLRRFIYQFSKLMNRNAYHQQAGRPLSYQKILEVQARALRLAIENQQPDYQGFLAK